MSAYELLSKVNVNEHTEKKNGLTYLSWAWAWGELLKAFPDSTYTIYENKDGWNYHTDGRTCWVKTGVTVEDKEYIEYLPVMDFKNRSIPADQVTSFDVNKAIQRSLTKAVARHGLGLYIYAGEDLPEGEEPEPKQEPVTDKLETTPAEQDKEEARRATIGVLMQKYGLDNPGFNALYKQYCLNVLKAPATILINKLTDEQFDNMILTINEQLKKGAA
jgi:hypothetical protein